MNADYRVIYVNGRRVYEHRYVMEQKLDRKLKSWEHVHHKDTNKRNNISDNLEIKISKKHSSEHMKQSWECGSLREWSDARTCCPKGHVYDKLRIRNGRKHRTCSECLRTTAREYQRRKRATL